MSNQQVRVDDESSRDTHAIPWTQLERRAGSMFTIGGVLLLASMVVPPGLAQIAEWAWAVGILVVGVAVLALATGLLGLYPTSERTAPWLSFVGAVSAVVAGIAALVVTSMGAVAVAAGVAGVDLGKPMGVFAVVGLSMGLGLALGLVTFGIALRTADTTSLAPGLLIAGGVALFVPIVGELLRRGVGLAVPGWLLFPVLAGLALDTLAIGHGLRRTRSGTASTG